jgi:predicted transcriptional regulator YdeE
MKLAEVDEFYVVGIAARTTNAREMGGQGVIAKQWDRLFSDGVLQNISGREDGTIYAVYTDYVSDHTGEYTFLLGAKVANPGEIPEGMVAKRIPAAKYAVVASERGPVAQVVVGAWQRVWTASPQELGGERAYRTDFEVYDERARDPQNSQVDVYVGLK